VIFNARRRSVVILGLVATAGVATLLGQREKPGMDDSMVELVAEIRGLRMAIERSMLANSQVQLLLGRVQFQENRLALLGRNVQEARARVRDARLAQAETERQIAMNADRLNEVSAPEDRQAMQFQLTMLREQLKQMQANTQQLIVEETAAADALSSEQARWADFNDKLEVLERTLAGQAGR
jgi:hypothetical protein